MHELCVCVRKNAGVCVCKMLSKNYENHSSTELWQQESITVTIKVLVYIYSRV